MTDIRTIALYFLSLSSMTHKKLQKLCYYAQAWHLANYGTPLMSNRFEAWIHGPVSPDLYFEYKEWGWLQIPKVSTPPALGDAERTFVENVYSVYGHYTPDELEYLTCRELPWRIARKGVPRNRYSRNPISA